ncbi:hypothetical protein J4G37_10075 [Microvirga sp. 3-52]|nr:hypothetical protein [Microvirga sp. 3-52]
MNPPRHHRPRAGDLVSRGAVPPLIGTAGTDPRLTSGDGHDGSGARYSSIGLSPQS